MPPGIVAAGIRKSFGSIIALAGVDVRVEPGQIVALMGENGSGKSTLLRILSTTVIADSGIASVAGHDVSATPRAARSRLGCILGDERSWYWRLTGRENLEFFAAMNGLRGAERRRRIERLAKEERLPALDRRVSDYSSGMRMRLALVRALITNPAVILLDEPTRSLDPAATEALRGKLADLARERHVAVLFVTHDLDDARTVAHRTLLLQAGKVVASSDASGLDELATLAVAPS